MFIEKSFTKKISERLKEVIKMALPLVAAQFLSGVAFGKAVDKMSK